MKVRYRPAVPADADALFPRLRESDLREMALVATQSQWGLRQAIAHSDPCYVLELDGEVHAVFGIGRLTDDPTIWLLRSDAVPARLLLEDGRRWLLRLREWESEHALWNIVPAGSRNAAWLERLGAVFSKGPTVNRTRFLTFRFPALYPECSGS